jgi:serine/threonine protein kinase/tetratricopeptide (TPR) repeat protein
MVMAQPQMALGGRFDVEREVGRGAAGIVYRATDRVTGQMVALKIIAIAGVDASEEARFQREGRLLAGLRHPGIVRLVAFGQLDEGQPYLAMEWLDGEDIAARQRRSPMPLAMCLEVAAQIADALAAAHAAGVVHRDVKPSNVLLVGSKDGAVGPVQAKLVDFGVAAGEDAKLTRTGAIIGTPAYMAPEQARGDGEIDARADLYSLGATLFEMIAGRPPHIGPTPIAILARLVTTPAPRLSEVLSGVPPELDEILAALLATAPGERPVSAEIVAEELRRISSEVALDVAHGARRVAPVVPDSESELSGNSQSKAPVSGLTPISSGGSRLVTSILAVHVPKGPARSRLVAHLRARGAEATELGGGAVVAHLGVRKAAGDEAVRALDIALRMAKAGASVGVATGRSRIDGTRPSGEVVDRAAALARDAARGSVLADTTTTELSRGNFEFQMRDDGSTLVNEQVAGKREAAGAGAPFVGRDAELAQVVGAFERAVDDRTPVVTTITGAPGIGKTRLRREALALIAAHPSAPRLINARAETFAKAQALGVAAALARVLAGVSKTDSLERAHEAVGELAVSPEARDYLARLLVNETLPAHADGRGARDALWLALAELALHEARKAPIVLSLEDAHWADGESLTLIDHLLGRASGLPLWVIATSRPVLWREDPNRFGGRDHVRIELRPLARRATRSIAVAVLGDRASGQEGSLIAETIAAQAGGSPLFAEELARLTAQGRDATSAPTIEAAMQVQLDALDDSVREAATRLSVYGLAGWDAGLSALGVANATDALRSLAGAEIVQEQSSSRFVGTREWAFKHALMREVAYASLAEETLREWHARAGDWLAKMGEDDATIARHYELGGRSKEAAHHLERAATRALAAHALADAVSMADKALAFAEDKPSSFTRALILEEAWSRLDARAGERDSAIRALEESVFDDASAVRARGARVRYEDACGGNPDTSDRLDQVRCEAQKLGLFDEEARTAAALASRYAFAGDVDRSEAVTADLITIAKARGIAAAAVDAYQTLAVVHQTRGDVGLALAARRSAAEAAHAAGLVAREATLTINVGFALTTMGARDEAREAIASGIALAQRIGSPGTVRHGQMNLLCWSATFGGPDRELDRLLEEPRSIAEAAIFGSWVPHDRATLGVLFYRGLELLASDAPLAAQQARTLLRTAAHGYRATEMLDVVPVALGYLSASELRTGNAEVAREVAREAALLLDQGKPSLLNEAPVFLALHEACASLGATADAKDAIARGIPRLQKRLQGLAGTPYAYDFFTAIRPNAELIAAATRYGLVPADIKQVMEKGPTSRRMSETLPPPNV